VSFRHRPESAIIEQKEMHALDIDEVLFKATKIPPITGWQVDMVHFEMELR
jgi:hypothetical protein